MQPQQTSRIDLAELKCQILKRIGSERSKRYFCYLSRFLSGKLGKGEFDKLCFRILGRENLPLHNQLIRSILKNACKAETPPPAQKVGPTKSVIEDGHEHNGNPVSNVAVWSNGVVLPMSPKKGRSVLRDRKLRDRSTPSETNGKAETAPLKSIVTEESGNKVIMENGGLNLCDYQRPVQHLPGIAEQSKDGREQILHGKAKNEVASSVDVNEEEEADRLRFFSTPLVAPIGIPFCSASIGGARIALPSTSSNKHPTNYHAGCLLDTVSLKKRMEQIAVAQGLGGVSLDSANTLNNMLDLYLKQLINSCVQLVAARSLNEPRSHPAQKQLTQGKLVNGLWPSNHLHMQSSCGPKEIMPPDQRILQSPLSLLDFRVAMELNPQQLGGEWPLFLEKICMQAFQE